MYVYSHTHTHTHTHIHTLTHSHAYTHTHACIHTDRQTDTHTETDRQTHAHTHTQRKRASSRSGARCSKVWVSDGLASRYRIRGVGPRSIPCRCCQCSCFHTSFCPASSYRSPAEASVTVQLQLPLCRKSHAAYGALDLDRP